MAAKALVLLVPLVAHPSEAWSCRLALVFAIDVSSSVNSEEYALQFQGLANALRDEEVQSVILDRGNPVALTVFEWSGVRHQRLVAGWSLLVNLHHVGRFARLLESHQRTTLAKKTAIGSALVYSMDLFAQGPECTQQVVDVSSDGCNNEGPTPEEVYASFDFADITVNALVISGLKRPALKRYFETKVIHGPGAFALATQNFDDYAEAIRRKLLRELRGSKEVAEVPSRQ
jgi:hypothetical protein